MTFESPVPCRKCGDPIVLGENDLGHVIPLESGVSVFKVTRTETGGRRRVVRIDQPLLVKHSCGKGKR